MENAAAPEIPEAQAILLTQDGFYQPWESSDEPEAAYKRKIPAYIKFDGDIFLKSMYEKYALEEKKCDDDGACEPTGNFYLNNSGCRFAAKEVLATHMDLTGEAQKAYLDEYFDKAFAHFDVNKAGVIEAYKMPAFFRFLMSDQHMDIG